MGEPKRASQGRENARRATAFRSRRGSRVAHTVGATATATGTCVTTYPRTRARAAGRDGKEESRPRVYPVTSTSATPVRASLHGRFAFGRARARIGGSPIRSCSSSRVDLCLALFRRLPLGFSLIKQLFCLVKELRLFVKLMHAKLPGVRCVGESPVLRHVIFAWISCLPHASNYI